MILAHRTLQPDSGITAIAPIKIPGANGTTLLAAQGSVLQVMDPKTLQIIDSYPFKTPISVLTVYPGPDPCVFVMLRNFNYFIFRIPEMIRYGCLSLCGSVPATRRILNNSSPFDRGSAGSNPNITRSIRFKESRISYASHPNAVAVSIASGYIHIIPKEKPPFSVSVGFSNIVDMCFVGPTLARSALRLAILVDGPGGARELHVVKISGMEFEEEFSLSLPSDAYMIIPLNQESESSLVISTSSGDHIISAPIDERFTQEPLSTHVSAISISYTPLGNDLYLILDAEGGIRAAYFPIEGRPKVDVFSNTQALGGSIAFMDNSIIVSSPFTDLMSLSYELTDTGCTVNVQARYQVNGPVRHLFFDGKRLLLSNEKIKLYEKTISCRTSTITDAGPIISIFSAGDKVCATYMASSVLLDVSESSFTVANATHFYSDRATVFFGRCNGGAALQVTSNTVSVLDSAELTFDSEITCASCSDKTLFVCQGNKISLYSLPSLELISSKEEEMQVMLITSTANATAALLTNNKIIIFNENGEEIDSLSAPCMHGYSSIACIFADAPNQYEILLGTTNGNIVRVRKGWEAVVEPVGEGITCMHQLGNSAICCGDPPMIIGNERVFIGQTPCRDIVKCNENFVLLQENTLRILNSETPGGSSRMLLDIDDLVNFTIIHREDGANALVCHQGEFSVKSYVNQRVANTFEAMNAISFMCKVFYQGRELIIVGTDEPYTIIVLDSNLSVVTKHVVEALPTAATVIGNYLIVANRSTIDFFVGKQSDSNYELEKVHYKSTYCLVTSLSTIDHYLVVSDSNQAVTVYFVTDNAIEDVDNDGNQRGISAVGILSNYIFAADYSNCISCYALPMGGRLHHIGEFMTDSRVLSFTNWGTKLIYGTEGGGIGSFKIVVNGMQELVEISHEIEKEGFCFINQRVPNSGFEWAEQDMIVDVDNLQVALTDKEILQKLGKDRESTKALFESIYD